MKEKLKKVNPKTKKPYTTDDLTYDEIEEVTTTNKKPTVVAYDTSSGDTSNAENFAIMLINPDTGEYFSGYNEAKRFFDKEAGKIAPAGKKESPAERAARIARGE